MLTTIASHGQWIKENQIGDDTYHCLNRADETPFFRSKKNGNNSTEESWLQWVRTPCTTFRERRCLGMRPEQCVEANCKFDLSFNQVFYELTVVIILKGRI